MTTIDALNIYIVIAVYFIVFALGYAIFKYGKRVITGK